MMALKNKLKNRRVMLVCDEVMLQTSAIPVAQTQQWGCRAIPFLSTDSFTQQDTEGLKRLKSGSEPWIAVWSTEHTT